ncbi:MAG TPA: hypothetical protein DIT26_00395, partial [Mesotoga infera]|nr:hypothetical protein [Mesotoga infera]
MNAGAESTISMLLSLERIRRLPSEFERFFSEDVEILTPVEIIEAESMRAGLSEIEVVQSAGVSGNAVMKISGAFSLRLSVTLAEASYSVFAALNEVRSKTAVFTVKLGDSRSEKTVEMSEKTIVKIGTVSGTGKETTLTVGGRVTEGSFDLDQIILVPNLAAVYLIKDNESLILNFKEHAGIDKGLSFENGRIYERERRFAEVPSVAVDTIEDGNLLHLDLRELFNNNGIAASDERKIANFDNPQGLFGASFISSELEKNLEHGFLSVGNTRFVVNIEGDDNFRLIGQAIELSAEEFDKICILGSANHGDYFGEALLIYEDNSQQTILVSFSDWRGGPSTGEKIAFEFLGRYDNKGKTE